MITAPRLAQQRAALLPVWLRILVAAGCITAAMAETSDGIKGWDWVTIPMLIVACIVLCIDACLIRVRQAIATANERVRNRRFDDD